MSISNFYSNGVLYTPNQVSSQETIENLLIKNNNTTVKHSLDNNNHYHITAENGDKLISFDDNNELQECQLKNHITSQIVPLNNSVSDHEGRLNSIENLQLDSDVNTLQGEINALIAYNNELKKLILAIKESLFITKSAEDTSEFDYTELLRLA